MRFPRLRSVIPAIAAACVTLCTGAALAQTDSHWATGVSGNWNDPTLWTTNPFFPNNGNGAPTYNAFIDPAGIPPGTPYTVSLNLPITINNFDITSTDATLDLTNFALTLQGTYLQQGSRVITSGSGSIHAAGAATFRAAAMQGVSDFTAQNTLTFDGAALTTINASTINHTGTAASWTGTGDIHFGGSTILNHNNAASTFTISNDQTLSWDNAGTRPVFNNAGTLQKTAGSGVTFFDGVTLTNTGTLRVDSGTFRANNTSIINNTLPAGSTWHITGSGNLDLVGLNLTTNLATVRLDGPNSRFDALNSLQNNTGTGRLFLENGKTYTPTSASFTNTGALINISPTSTFQTNAGTSFTDTSGMIMGNGGGTLRAAGPATFQGTTMQSASVVTTGNLFFTGAAPSDICDTDIDHSGPSCQWSGPGGMIMGGGTPTFRNGAASTFTILNDASISWDTTGTRPVFTNLGTLQKNTATGTTSIAGVALNNTGTLAVNSGTISADSVQNVAAGTLTGGTWRISNGSSLVFPLPGQAITTNAANVTLAGVGSAFDALTANIRTNAPGAQLEIKDGRSLTTIGNFTNTGMVKITAQAAPTTFAVLPGSQLTNFSNNTLTGGQFVLEGAGRIDARLEFDGANVLTLDAGLALMGAGAGVFETGGANGLTNLQMIGNSGDFQIAQGHNFDTLGNFTVGMTGAITVSDTTIFSVAPGFGLSNFDHNGNPGLFEDGTFNIQGTLIADNAHVTMLNNTTVLDGPDVHIQNRDGGNNNAFSTLSHILSGGHLTLSNGQMLTLNPGTLTTDVGSSLQVGPVSIPGDTRLIIQGDFQQNGSLILASGEVDVQGSHFANGPIQGEGTIRIGPRADQRLFLNTTLAPGGAPDPAGHAGEFGVLTVAGGVQLQAMALIDIQIGGHDPGTQYDRLNILGELFFDNMPNGTLRVALADGFIPFLNEEFTIITYDSHDAGRFAGIDGLDLGNGYFFIPIFDTQSFRVRFVPAPGAALGLGLAASLAALRRSRRAA